MDVLQTSIELMVANVSESLAFYRTVLAFETIAEESDEKGFLYWAMAEQAGFRVSFKREDRIKQESPFFREKNIGGSISLNFQVKDLLSTYEAVKEACELLNHPHLTPCGSTQFSLKDNNGYILTIEQFD